LVNNFIAKAQRSKFLSSLWLLFYCEFLVMTKYYLKSIKFTLRLSVFAVTNRITNLHLQKKLNDTNK